MKLEFVIKSYKNYNISLEPQGYEVSARFATKIEAEITKSFLENIVASNDSLSSYLEKLKELKNGEHFNTQFTISELILILQGIKQGRDIKL